MGRRLPAIGTDVQVIGGPHKGKTGYVWKCEAAAVTLFCNGLPDPRVRVSPGDVRWKRVLPPVGTVAVIVSVEGYDGLEGEVVGYATVETAEKKRTSLGLHYGSKVCSVMTEWGAVPIPPANLLWAREAPEYQHSEEEMPLPPPGLRSFDLTERVLPRTANPTQRPSLHIPQPPAARKTALYQLRLDDPKAGRAVRSKPSIMAPVRLHVLHAEIFSVVLPSGTSAIPEGWLQLLSGGYLREQDDEVVPLEMTCPVCGVGFPTEQAGEEHFEAAHPRAQLKIAVSGAAAARSETRSEPLRQTDSASSGSSQSTRVHSYQYPTVRRELPARQNTTGMAPAWFVLAKPTRLGSKSTVR